MIPHSDANAPSVDRGVLRRMRTLDPNLVITWSEFAFDPFNGGYLLHAGRPVKDPAFYLWRRDDNSSHHFLVSTYPNGFGHRQVLALERDLARFHSTDEMLRMLRDAQSAQRDRGLARRKDVQRDKIKYNESLIGDILGGKSDRRQAKIASYPGQGRRGTPGEVQMDSREIGWEVPEAPGEER